jgi:hypothetical protein
MMKKIFSLLFLISNSIIIFYLSCCSTIGLGLGEIYDSHNLEIDTIPLWDVLSYRKGTRLNITLDTGTDINAKYFGFQPVDEQVYTLRYNEFREELPSDIILPMLGDTINFTLKSGEEYRAKFKGFDYRYMLSEIIDIKTTEKLPLTALELIVDSHGNITKENIISNLLDEGRMPIIRQLIVQTNSGLKPIFMDEVKLIKRYDKKNYGKIAGFILGIVYDMIILDKLED